jgi:hypothetical protein
MATIHKDKYFTVRHFRASSHVRVIRSGASFERVSDAMTGLEGCKLALAGIAYEHYGVLFDWRSAPLSVNPQLHQALVEHIDELARRFARRAFLVHVGVGSMQAGRVGRALSSNVLPVFDDEAEALKFVGWR